MSRTQTTNVLLVLVLIALVANLVLSIARPEPAYAVRKSEISQEAQEVADRVALDRVLGDIGPAVRDMAASNRLIADAIRDHARATDRIARAIQGAAMAPMPSPAEAPEQ